DCAGAAVHVTSLHDPVLRKELKSVAFHWRCTVHVRFNQDAFLFPQAVRISCWQSPAHWRCCPCSTDLNDMHSADMVLEPMACSVSTSSTENKKRPPACPFVPSAGRMKK
ncbi:MAG TPA: hypothetical protein VL051_08455, partial [Burkholderiaceae bacterium]|nr:hypothetical protein [Burkholderiaceae bacterium]